MNTLRCGLTVRFKVPRILSRMILTRLAIRLHTYEWAYVDLNTAQERLRDALKAYKKESANTLHWREDHKTELANQRADANGTTVDTELFSMHSKEKARRLGTISNRIRQKPGKETVRRIEYTAQDGATVESLTQNTIVQACATCNYKRQTQSEDTPFPCEPLVSQIGFLAEKEASIQILQGTCNVPPTVDKYTQEFIAALEMPAIIRQSGSLNMTITPDEHIQAWKRQPDRIASEPHGLSFAHYKSVLKDKYLVHMDMRLRSIPLEVGFIPDENLPGV
jgi:hypothetical protein